jgi:hypothetical protein
LRLLRQDRRHDERRRQQAGKHSFRNHVRFPFVITALSFNPKGRLTQGLCHETRIALYQWDTANAARMRDAVPEAG